MNKIDLIQKRIRIVETIKNDIENRGVSTMDCVGSQDVYLIVQCATIAAAKLQRSPFECTFQFMQRRLSREDDRELIGFHVTMKSKPEKTELPKQRTNAIMELEI